ncbi:WecB/TagA/CpsF family glycosyltransferase [Altericroceibacterium spongiae]|uniref:WecB/TagA/CpsF family glycosyltransferase n=2 Tax=Altericroceibacterium spongiae TaxID=2320269 RepID=A0A420ECA4_9SPHN|nr:WecB/TagA/CpsF family glycosyltransferase [Altericroceibacterium spongiae]
MSLENGAVLSPEQALDLIAERSKLSLRRETLFNLPLIHARRNEIAGEIVRRAGFGARTTINFVNAHCINTLYRDPAYEQALRFSDLILPDGSGMRIAARMSDVAMGDNLNGTDLFPEICEAASRTGASIYLLGGAPGIARDAALTMVNRYNTLRLAGTMHGYFKPEDEDALIDRINASGADILFVGFGVPLQEKWIERNRERLDAAVVLGVGGLFDYYSGRIARAPAPVRAIGCEWAWRLAMEPRRLAKRYLLGNAMFLFHAAFEGARCRGYTEQASLASKRAMDLAITLMAMLVLLPVFLAVALAIKLDDGGPVLFRQTRIGEGGRNFQMLKFRSMRCDAEHHRAALLAQSDRDSTCFKMKHDPRITRIGRFLRRLSIDELPQLLNVLKGEMSLVGPRPALPAEAEQYRGEEWMRLAGKPGITCIWQVSGRAEIAFGEQVLMDRAYLAQRSLMSDCALLFRTVPAVLSGRGAY